MEENKAIIIQEEKSQLAFLDSEPSLALDMATELGKGYEDIKDLIVLLGKDTRVDDILGEDDQKVGQRTHIHPQLLKWYQEARHTIESMWKMGGGEIAQEAEKEKIKLKGKLIMEIIGKNPQQREEILEKWKQVVSFKK
jgi:hypothetical protein